MNSQLIGALFMAIICIYFIYSKNNVYLIGDNSFDILVDIQSHMLNTKKEISLQKAAGIPFQGFRHITKVTMKRA